MKFEVISAPLLPKTGLDARCQPISENNSLLQDGTL